MCSPPQKKKKRKETALTSRLKAASPKALQGRQHQNTELTRKERDFKNEIRERLIAYTKGMKVSSPDLYILKARDDSRQDTVQAYLPILLGLPIFIEGEVLADPSHLL